MKKVIVLGLLVFLIVLNSGCSKNLIQNKVATTSHPKDTSSVSNTPTTTPIIEPSKTPTIAPITAPTPTLEELSMEAYEKFMKNQAKVSFDRFMPEDNLGEAFYKKGSEYTLLEALNIITAHYFDHSEKKKVKYIDYSYIDCGKDGVNELVLRFNGMDIYCENDDSTLVYIIKYIDGKLSLCDYYETWARSHSTINEYGYYQLGGSSGASRHGVEYGLIDKDGNWQFIAAIESEIDISQLAWEDKLGQIPKIAQTKGIEGGIELDTISLNDYEECLYTFYVYDNNMDRIKDANLYTNSIYKEIFDEAKVPFITPDEVSKLKSENEKMVGATAEIIQGPEITWKDLSENMFSDYVGK
jgi:hypothetical protein